MLFLRGLQQLAMVGLNARPVVDVGQDGLQAIFSRLVELGWPAGCQSLK